jgi:hypothetical protein
MHTTSTSKKKALHGLYVEGLHCIFLNLLALLLVLIFRNLRKLVQVT